MLQRPRRRRRTALAVLICLASASACTDVPAPHAAAGPAGTAITPSPAVADWRDIPIAPLGTELAVLHSGLHEILYFQDTQQAAEPPPPGEPGLAADCYRANGPLPRVLNRGTRDYVLCFVHDRLARVEAVLDLPAAEAHTLEQRLCDAWVPGSLGTRSEESCSGRAGEAAFRVAWRRSDSQSGAAQSGAALSIVVYSPERPQ
jgi:hypothetical protein